MKEVLKTDHALRKQLASLNGTEGVRAHHHRCCPSHVIAVARRRGARAGGRDPLQGAGGAAHRAFVLPNQQKCRIDDHAVAAQRRQLREEYERKLGTPPIPELELDEADSAVWNG